MQRKALADRVGRRTLEMLEARLPLAIDLGLEYAGAITSQSPNDLSDVQTPGHLFQLDKAGNAYIGTISYPFMTCSCDYDVDPGPGTNVITARSPILVAKIAPDGGTVWNRTIAVAETYIPDTNPRASVNASSIAVSDQGEVYLAGSFQGPVFFDTGSDEQQEFTGDGFFLLKIDSNGHMVWINTFELEPASAFPLLALAPSGDLALLTRAGLDTDLDPGPDSAFLPAASWVSNAVLARYRGSDGAFLGAQEFRGSADSTVFPQALKFTAEGSLYVSLHLLNGEVDLDPGPGEHSVVDDDFGKTNGVGSIVRLDPSGAFASAYTVRGATFGNLEHDGNGNLYVTGSYYPGTDFDPGLGQLLLPDPIHGPAASFVLKLAPEGPVWAHGGFGPTLRLTLTAHGNALVTGLNHSEGEDFVPVDFDPGPGEAIVDTSSFLLSFTSNGGFEWVTGFDATHADEVTRGYVWPQALRVATDGAIWVSGNFYGVADFDPSDAQNLINSGAVNEEGVYPRGVFLIKLRQLDIHDIDSMWRELRSASPDPRFDLTGDGLVDAADRDRLILEILDSTYGDANRDGFFDSSDLVQVFQRGQYGDSIPFNSTWNDGDWDGDGDFDSSDLVLAFSTGAYEKRLM